MLIKNARVVKRLNRFKADAGMERMYDYRIDLTRRQYYDLKRRGLPVKKIKAKEQFYGIVPDEWYFINVTPAVDEKGNLPNEDSYLNRDDVNIDFKIIAREINDNVIVKLYFRQSDITEVKKNE